VERQLTKQKQKNKRLTAYSGLFFIRSRYVCSSQDLKNVDQAYLVCRTCIFEPAFPIYLPFCCLKYVPCCIKHDAKNRSTRSLLFPLFISSKCPKDVNALRTSEDKKSKGVNPTYRTCFQGHPPSQVIFRHVTQSPSHVTTCNV